MIRLSLTCLSAARQTEAARNRSRSAAQILKIIVTGHCTPVERTEKGCLFAPVRLHTHMKVEVDLHAEQPLHFLPRQRTDLFQHRTLRADDDGLLAIALHADCGVDARDLRAF